MPTAASDRAWGAAVVLLTWGLFLTTLAPGVFWLDSGELTAAAHTLGIPHPPGHPLYLVLAKLAALLPVGSVAIRVSLLSAFFGSLAALALYALTLTALRLQERRASATDAPAPSVAHAPAAAFAALAFAASPALWFQSVRAEVYTLHLALVLLPALWLLRRHLTGVRTEGATTTRATFACAAFAAGLALGNHHLLVLLSLPALLWLALTAKDARRALTPAALATLALIGLWALLPYVALPLRARLLPAMHWGDATTLSGFFDLISAKVFQGSVDPSVRASLGQNLVTALALFMEQLSVPVFFAGCAGLAFLLARRPRAGVGLTLLLLGSLLSKVLMFLDPQNPDDHGYFAAAMAVLALGAGVLLGALGSALARRLPARLGAASVAALVGALAFGALVAQTARHVRSCSLAGFRSPDIVLDATLEAVPPRALILPYYYALHFTLQYAQLVENRRPDVAVVHQTFAAHIDEGEPYLRWLAAAHPHLADIAEAFRREGAFPQALVLERARGMPVYVEAFRERVLPAETLEPLGILARAHPDAGAPPEDSAPALALATFREGYWGELVRRLGDELHRHPHTNALVLWYAYLEAHLLTERGERSAARQAVRRGLEWRPDTPRLQKLAAEILDE